MPADARRTLKLMTYADVTAEIERLRETAYRPLGAWSLGEICGHLSYYFRGSLTGFEFTLPWALRTFVGRPWVKRVLKTGVMKPGGKTVPDSVVTTVRSPAAEQALIEDCLMWLVRLDEHDGPLHDSPLAGKLSPEEWRRLHCIHAGHHLGFLVPAAEESAVLEETMPA
ncbi:MAG: DUF1569 domain-containing protein [Planctomycetota bacterium]